MKQRVICIIALLGTIAFASLSHARDRDSGFYLTGLLGYTFFDSERNLEDDPNIALGLGYDFSKVWSAEALIGGANLEVDDSSRNNIDNRFARLDALYHFSPEELWRPFLVAGVGHNEFEDEADNKFDETQFNLGAGIKHEVNDNLDLRFDARALYSHDEESMDALLNLGISYLFGSAPPPPPPADSDGDGVIDDNDSCPNSAYGVTVDARGCEVIGDADNDGVLDNVDKCPNTQPNIKVDATGCPIIGDADKDGVKDNVDACPNTPKGAKVDTKGCRLQLEKAVSIKLEVNFANNSDVVEPQYYSEIEKVVSFMKEYPDTTVVVEGHTDDRGSAKYNQNLSERRAKAVREVIVNRYGIAGNRISSVGYGESRPTADNSTKAGRDANRRVVAVIQATKMVDQ